MKGNILAVYFLVAKADMRVSLHAERVEIWHLEGPCPMFFSFVTDTEEDRVLFFAISFSHLWINVSKPRLLFINKKGHFFLFLLFCRPLWFTMNALLLTFLADLPRLSTVLAW